MRYEERGLLKPCYIDPSSKRRYYDIYNVLQIFKIKEFTDMGISHTDIIDYFDSGGDDKEIIMHLKERIDRHKTQFMVFNKRHTKDLDMTYHIEELPEVLCVYKPFDRHDVKDSCKASADFLDECIERGLSLAPISFYLVHDKDISYVCVPIEDKKVPNDAIVLKKIKALVFYIYGHYDEDTKVWEYINKTLKELDISPKGPIRVEAVIGPFYGKEIDPDRYFTKFAIPIE